MKQELKELAAVLALFLGSILLFVAGVLLLVRLFGLK